MGVTAPAQPLPRGVPAAIVGAVREPPVRRIRQRQHMSTRLADVSSANDRTPAEGDARHILRRCLSLDLEVGRDERIRAFAGVRPDTGERVISLQASDGLAAALAGLDRLSQGADFVLGHNLISFDLPHLRAASPNLRLLRLPAVDTLMLNPLAYPRNPYHHLVKHYQDGQLQRDRINDPELDARLALQVFANQQEKLRDATPDLLIAWHWLTGANGGDGFDRVFTALRRASRPADAEARAAIRARLDGNACRNFARDVVADAARHGWSLAYALAWLSVAGGNSVMPPWVRHQFPDAGRLVRGLRDAACADAACGWCRERHDARKELTRWFGFPNFREEPSYEPERPMQQAIVESAMAGKHVLGIMPTGAGKSLCYQVPALSRYDKTGSLTVVISPLVALMSDQVKGLEARGIVSCVTINGLLSLPERKDALDRVRLGDAGILLISPEQLRNVSVRRVLEQREIGAWVLDEAHCLSRWGHDFRPDYRYVGRFIRERTGEDPVPPLLCLTATAKPDVLAEIVDYFQQELGITLTVFDGGAQRANLDFVVLQTSGEAKFAHIHQILEEHLPACEKGGAIVYCATRRQTEQVADFLGQNGIAADFFHAGLSPETKKNVQDSFINGDLRAIVATNAFGMGIDKPDVRVVIHADIPGSLENYLQEAGRAGRDQRAARCVLLYTQDDAEKQFGMSARSRLTRREIHGVLRALRNLDRKRRLDGVVVATAGEILGEDEDHEFERDSATDDTRTRTAVAWLEEAVLLTREENHVQVFPSSLRVNSIEQARARLQKAVNRDEYRRQLLSIFGAMLTADPDEGISTDELMAESGLSPEGVRGALYDLERLGIASNDTVLTAFVHTGVQRASRRRFEQAAALEQAVIDLLRETHPDMEQGETSPLHLRIATQRLKDDGHDYALPERVRRIVRSIAADGRGEGGGGGSLGLRGRDAETMQVTLQREWKDLERLAELRRTAASGLLNHLLASLPQGSRGTDLLAETTMGKLLAAIKSDMTLTREVREDAMPRLLDRALLWLHEQEVIRLNRGLTVFRPAMTIRLEAGTPPFRSLRLRTPRNPLRRADTPDSRHDGVRQTGPCEDGRRATIAPGGGLFQPSPGRTSGSDGCRNREMELSRQTTPESWQTIVESLRNPIQRRIVADEREQTNVLVLAGPGSGKTRVLVHRIAYLVRARRENPRGILALAYNRHAAVEIRRRLAELIGDDARGVMVLTCHALAMRLVGASFTGRANQLDDSEFKKILRDAVVLLRGQGLPPDEADEQRTRLLAGFRWILMDEYQDIGPEEYALISALAGRTLSEQDDKLTLFAVGDDDQNIYSFKGASVKFIRRFEKDYGARPAYLTGNYRSTGHIIDAANSVIEPARQRMKTGHPIHVNRARANEPPGGAWANLDTVTQGRVQILPAGDTPVTQAQTVVAELKRLAGLAPGWDWSTCAVIARRWRYLDPVRSLCELEGIPTQMAKEDFSGIWHLRETRALVNWVRGRDSRLVASADLSEWVARQPSGPWVELLSEAVSEYATETGGLETPVDSFVEWLAEWGREARRRQRGLLLTTAHRAKGLEFDHVVVLDGHWNAVGRGEDADAPRRLYYVAMTRARQTLTLARLPGPHPIQDALTDSSSVLRRPPPVNLPTPAPELARRYRRLSLRDVFLGYAGYLQAEHPAHRAIASLSPGDRLRVRQGRDRWELTDRNGFVVGQLAASFTPPAGMRCAFATVLAVVTWDKEKSEPQYQANLRCDSWEVVVPELVFEPA